MSARRTIVVITAVVIVLITATWYSPGIASMGGDEKCSPSDGQYILDLYATGALTNKETNQTVAFQIINKFVIEQSLSLCRDQRDQKKTHRIEYERYILKVRISDRARQPRDLYLYCERYIDMSPAGACGDGSSDVVVEHRILTPTYKSLVPKRKSPKTPMN